MNHTLDLGHYASLRASGPFRLRGAHAVAGISGGRTSGLMAALLDERVVLTYQNAGKEHEATLEYLNELDAVLGHRVVWLEFRKPRAKGARPKEFEFARVSFATCARKGEPFEDFMEALAEYRATKSAEPLAPWARQRMCTAYMKRKVQEHYVESLGWDDYDSFVGLRSDEIDRVNRLKERDTQARTFRCPLFDAGIAKPDVLEFWRAQSFNLRLPSEAHGNCTNCYLKDQSDIARLLHEDPDDAAWWIAMGERYPNFGGQRFPGYRQLAAEAPARLAIERALAGGGAHPAQRRHDDRAALPPRGAAGGEASGRRADAVRVRVRGRRRARGRGGVAACSC